MKKIIKQSYFNFLSNEISDWQKAQLIDDTQAQALLDVYQVRDNVPWMAWVLSLLAALLVGGGVILVLAHNWHELNRLTRALIALAPLIVMQLACWWLFKAGKTRTLAGEVSAILLVAAQGAAVALVSQTYHIHGELSQFFLLWFVMAFASALPMRSRSLFITAMLLLSAYAMTKSHIFNYWYWSRHEAWSGTDSFNLFLLSLAGAYAFAWGGVLERWTFALALPFVLFSGYLGFFEASPVIAGIYYLLGLLLAKRGWRNPLYTLGTTGILSSLFTIILTDSMIYNQFKWRLVWLLLGLMLLCLVVVWRKNKALLRQLSTGIMLAVPLLYVVLLSANYSDNKDLLFLIIHGFALVAGLAITYNGLQTDRLLKVNVGLSLLSVLIIDVFFDGHWSLLMRGMSFVLCGLLLFGVNFWFMRRRKA